MKTRSEEAGPGTARSGPRLVAVLDIGATAVRMEIAEVDAAGSARTLEALTLPVGLGRDTFTLGHLRPQTIEECVRGLRRFRDLLREYGIQDRGSIRAVATSAVREAENREQFLNRVYLATGFRVECLEDVELTRIAYMAVRDLLQREAVPHPWNHLVIEVGGGSTELILIENDRVIYSDTYRLGALRLQEMLDLRSAAPARARALLLRDIERVIAQMRQDLPPRVPDTLIAMSGDARFAASRLSKRWEREVCARLSPRTFGAFAERLASLTPDEIVREYALTYPEAETVGLALLIYAQIVRHFGIREIWVPKVHLRTGLEIELASRTLWTSDFVRQIEMSARLLGEKFRVEPRHANHVAHLCDRLFEALRAEHGLDARYGLLLRIAALLHEAGLFVNNRNHHKHSLYLIQNSDLFGLTQEDISLVALIARYHRRSMPDPAHPVYSALDRDRKLVVQALAALLRVADALDRGHTQRIEIESVETRDDRCVLWVSGADDLTVERLALREKGDLFEAVYGRQVILERVVRPRGMEGNV